MSTETTESKASSLENAEAGSVIVCPCCGQLMQRKDVTIEESLIDHWLSCMVTGVPFTHTYELYNNKLKLTLTAMSEESRDLLKNIQHITNVLLSRSWKTKIDNEVLTEAEQFIRNCILFITVEVDTNDQKQLLYPADAIKDYIEQLKTIYKDLFKEDADEPDLWQRIKDNYNCMKSTSGLMNIPSTVLFKVLNAHLELIQTLEEQGFDSNFWMGIKRV